VKLINTRRYSKIQEKRVAKMVGGYVQPNSGATPFFKGDVRTSNILFECKTTTSPKKSFSIKKEWLDKLDSEVFQSKKELGVLVFNYEPNGKEYAIIPLSKLVALLNNKE
jgi:hypothetical protein